VQNRTFRKIKTVTVYLFLLILLAGCVIIESYRVEIDLKKSTVTIVLNNILVFSDYWDNDAPTAEEELQSRIKNFKQFDQRFDEDIDEFLSDVLAPQEGIKAGGKPELLKKKYWVSNGKLNLRLILKVDSLFLDSAQEQIILSIEDGIILKHNGTLATFDAKPAIIFPFDQRKLMYEYTDSMSRALSFSVTDSLLDSIPVYKFKKRREARNTISAAGIWKNNK